MLHALRFHNVGKHVENAISPFITSCEESMATLVISLLDNEYEDMPMMTIARIGTRNEIISLVLSLSCGNFTLRDFLTELLALNWIFDPFILLPPTKTPTV